MNRWKSYKFVFLLTEKFVCFEHCLCEFYPDTLASLRSKYINANVVKWFLFLLEALAKELVDSTVVESRLCPETSGKVPSIHGTLIIE